MAALHGGLTGGHPDMFHRRFRRRMHARLRWIRNE